jgi:putative transposase
VQAVQALKAMFPLDLLLAVAGLARSTYFYHQARLARPTRHAELDTAITQAFTQAQGRYGHRRIHRVLVTAGWRVAKKTVLDRMRRCGLVCRVRRRRHVTTYRGDPGTTAPNTLGRAFTAARPNQKWVTDLTEFRIGEEKRYLSPVMDLFDRQIIAYTVGRSPNLELTTLALRQALATIGPTDHPVIHSDQGMHYRHHSWQTLVREAGATPSMSRKGNCLDNAVIESFFGQLKSELLLESFPTITALETALHAYIHWYNHDRISTIRDGLSPVAFRAQATVP